ncbi:hydrogenase maturation nickel metallochaperone HypA [Synechococcus sp. PCC 7336]|uniref:hydrogenase maturation nickel metallochaperone HypA n=1 Tax=Synechococcus sp. PCC 7336 TaxID=195250 RepID=UPI00035C9D35|nr:hydrogenase maturation nickel metallochaperone HypA [Synechococcus sp. PCC 7336]
MHEVDMTKALFATLEDWWVSQPDPPEIETVYLLVGDFTCVEPASLEFAFDALKQGTFLDSARLAIERIPFVAYCHTCQCNYFPTIEEQYACPACRSPLEDIRSGRELKISRLECRDAVAAEEQTMCHSG